MATKTMQWVPIEGTRWRNEVTDGPDTPMADKSKTGTTLIEEGALWPESLPFESEPWTSFYMAGEFIRGLRKAAENKKVNVPATKNAMRKAA
jgi:hypothetical protein